MGDWRKMIIDNYRKKDFDMHDTKCGILKLGKEYMAVTLSAYGMFETLGEAEQYMSEWGYEKENCVDNTEITA